MVKKFKGFLVKTAGIMEIIIAGIVLIAVVVACVHLVMDSLESGGAQTANSFDLFLNRFLGIVVGIELVKMLIKHTPGSVLEVLIFAISRQMVISHTNALNTLIYMAAIAGLFAVRRYFFHPNQTEHGDHEHRDLVLKKGEH